MTARKQRSGRYGEAWSENVLARVALAAEGGLVEHRSGLACKPHYPLPGLKARPLPEGEVTKIELFKQLESCTISLAG